jgi:omega-amidase
MRKMKLAHIQFAAPAGEIDRNRKTAERLTRQAAGQGAQLVCLPELFTTAHDFDFIRAQSESSGYGVPQSETQGENQGQSHRSSNESSNRSSHGSSNSEAIDWLGELALSLKIHLAAGTLPEKEEGRFYNTAFLFNDQGKMLGRYRKIHLFPPMGEDTFFTPGQDCPVFDTPLAKVGICICYDLRFPSQFADLAAKGAQIILVPARFPHPRLDHWRTLLRARAIENYLFVAGCNCIGTFSRQLFCGHSCIISPWGETLAEAGEREGVVMAEIDLDQVEESRSLLR